jgi:uncharacterized protein with ATP-grasp and redox domains
MASSTAVREPWRCDRPGTFAHLTCTARWPRILDGIAADVPAGAAALRALRDEIVAGVVTGLAVDNPERARWAAIAPWAGRPWTALPWYLAESYLYARVRQAVGYHLHGVDPFRAPKQREEQGVGPPIVVDDSDAALAAALWRALWGNRADLSLPSARDHVAVDDADLVVDDRVAALSLLRGARRVAVLLDNAGAELAADLALARALAARGVAVTLFAKDAPFFVSDAMPADVDHLVARGHGTGGAVVVTDRFLTGPGFLRTPELPSSLQMAWGACDVIIAKGDCNYRRLVSDRPWDAADDARFVDVVDLPAPVIALRTLKAEVQVGGDPARVARARSLDPGWLVSGRFGVVQVAGVPSSTESPTGGPDRENSR